MADRLQGLIEGACSPANSAPDLALNLEICDLINKKQGTFPRVAAMTIVKFVNSRHPNQAMLALSLLDQCVKNCGYAFHLQMGTKEFLNTLVRKFPSHPMHVASIRDSPNPYNHFDISPIGSSAPHAVLKRILYMLKEWKVGLVDRLPYREDIINIKNMYRLLRLRGYRFPELHESSLAALTAIPALQTPEELEQQDNDRLSAKLQEHIRRGGPQDLVVADALMKALTGHEIAQRYRPDYKKKFLEQLRGIRSKAIVLYELLENMQSTEKPDAVMQNLKTLCASSNTKLKRMLEKGEVQEEHESLQTLSVLLGKVLQKYADIDKGIYDTHYNILENTPASQTPATSTQQQPQQTTNESVSLIDLDDDIYDSPNISEGSDRQKAMDDLCELFGQTASVSPASSPSIMESGSPASSSPTLYSPSPRAGHETALINSSASNGDDVQMLNKNGLQIDLCIARSETEWNLKAFFSNQSTAPMENINLQLAAPKSMQLQMGPISSGTVPPKSWRAVNQSVVVKGPQGDPLRLRFKVTYHQLGVSMEQAGEYHHVI
ncbi:hypothetical protein BCR43DRAFT_513492 [Syncephalastrum racemosum]|uniref:VHS domain-domain-containing protein n=1 Tax=Syncephalastrum racemosum TaxID=13706 RepID=A0A1X2HK04_SYNRA|nr:hypothetical protein BCR43DRAFT_513492 [Syncephalastrum racemosum]